jgi:pyruvate dehydrogenase E1 component alpha subunit
MLQQAPSQNVFSISAEGVPSPFQLLDREGNLLVEEAPLGEERVEVALRAMLLGRRFDERCVQLQRRGLMVTLAPGIGQEACSVGSVLALEHGRDWFVPQYREVAGQLLHGLPLVQGFLWHMGSAIGFRISPGLFMLPFQAAVSGQIPHAVGLAWGFQIQNLPSVVVVHFGDGGTSQGDFHEAANLAGVVRAPVVFFCQNNYWGISTPRELQTASPTLAQKALAYGFPGLQVDGNDLFAVYEATRQAVERARRGDGPTLIEGVTYRLGIHTTADDGTRCEPPGLREQWKPQDPLIRVERYLEKRGGWSAEKRAALEREIEAELDSAWEQAKAYPHPPASESLKHVFAQMPPRIAEQHRAMRGREEG